MKFSTFSIAVHDIEASIDFYRTMTELKIVREIQGDGFQLAFLADKEGDTEIELIQMPTMQKFEGKGFFLIFSTDKLDEMHALATERGWNPSDVRNPDPATRYFFVYDPSGVSIELRESTR